MGRAKAMIQEQLVPQGEDVVRHLALPQESKSLEWILEEMDKMDTEGKSHTDYKEGKLSGAVYRELLHLRLNEAGALLNMFYKMVERTWRKSLFPLSQSTAFQTLYTPTCSLLFAKWKPKSSPCA